MTSASDSSLSAVPTTSAAAPPASPAGEIHLRRRNIDRVLIGMGAVAAVVFAVAAGLLTWGSNFAGDYVHDELSSQHVTFPAADELRAEGRDDLVSYGGEDVTTGTEAEAYASYISGHLEGIAGGLTYAQIDDRGAAEAVVAAEEAGAGPAEIAELQAKADTLAEQRDSLFRGETLRGLLLTSYAWDTVGDIAAIAGRVCLVGALLMVALVIAGLVHLRRSKA